MKYVWFKNRYVSLLALKEQRTLVCTKKKMCILKFVASEMIRISRRRSSKEEATIFLQKCSRNTNRTIRKQDRWQLRKHQQQDFHLFSSRTKATLAQPMWCGSCQKLTIRPNHPWAGFENGAKISLETCRKSTPQRRRYLVEEPLKGNPRGECCDVALYKCGNILRQFLEIT